jgi:hypothetical protein
MGADSGRAQPVPTYRVVRESGPIGWLTVGGERYALDGWEYTEHVRGTRRSLHGWFSCGRTSPLLDKNTPVHLALTTWEDGDREIDVRITVVSTADHVWEFRLDS